MKTEKQRVIDFLELNKWEGEETCSDEDYQTFIIYNSQSIAIDINDEEIVLIGGSGDFLHLPLDVFALLGALLHYRVIDLQYRFPGGEG